MHVSCDVLVIGAGPAGSTAAAALARAGHQVILVDRDEFPRDKTCGDGIPPGTIGILNDLGMEDAFGAAAFYPIHGIVLGSPRGRTWETGFRPRHDGAQFLVAPRAQFDALIRDHAVACGARFMNGTFERLSRRRDAPVSAKVKTGRTIVTIRARVVIGADGATSAVARALGREKQPARARGVALRAYVEGIRTTPHRVEFYFDRELLPGYGWVFPLGSDRANVGVILRADKFKERGVSLNAHFERFLHAPRMRDRTSDRTTVSGTATWQLPYAQETQDPRAYDGALLVGDAGGFVDPLTGEGIHGALVTAMIAADVTGSALAAGDTSRAQLAAYDARCNEALGALTKRSLKLERFITRWPWALEPLFMGARMGTGFVQSFINHVSTDFVAQR